MIWSTITRSLLGAAVLLAGASAWAAPGVLTAGETRLIFDAEQLAQIGLEVSGAADKEEQLIATFAGKPLGSLVVEANAAKTPHSYLDGALTHRGRLTLDRLSESVLLQDFRLQGDSDDATAIVIVDDQGHEYFRGDFIHYHAGPDGRSATLKEMDLVLSPWLATQLGEPRLAGFVIGTMEVDIEFDPLPSTATEKGDSCGPPIWIDESKGLISDVRLTMLGDPTRNHDPLVQVARQDGYVGVAVGAELDNVGSADAPWYEKFRIYQGNSEPINPPYGNDQHPYLVWTLYREQGVRLEPVGFSSAKHAFYAVNNPCTPERDACRLDPSDGRLLRFGCQDWYGVNSNDNARHLGPRAEIEAATGIWVSEGSFFDRNSNGVQDADTRTRQSTFDRRMRVAESDLEVADARYLTEAWYINRDDADIYNSMGNIEVDPDFIGSTSTWVFPAAAGSIYEFGPAINQWVDPDAVGAGEGHQELVTTEGRFIVAAKTEDLGDGRYRYVYGVMNLDYDPQVQEILIPVSLGATPADFYFADGDHDPLTDWTPTVSAQAITWNAPAATGLDWGLMATFEFTSTAAPEGAELTLRALENASKFDALLPMPRGQISNDLIFTDGFGL